ncbi:glycerophosphoryl diester phosphodiesterase membrane domain-containing protein [Paenibacillaceae bacterium WGS1546]|uniref:glycerophosphoryl diester phosphodiesterase membrane domain-containing protein n=1 Tax=Cohnella sp. WGS1546 TaxID=3366810 RepID=UPI00372D620F
MFKLLARSLRDFRDSYPKLLSFEFLYTLLLSVVVVPLITLIFDRILAVVGSGSLLNGEIYRIGLTFEGLIGMAAIGFVASLALFVELCVLVILIQQRYFGQEIAIADALATTLRRTPRLLGVGTVQLLAMLLLMIPFVESPLSDSFYALFNAPIFLQSKVLSASAAMTLLYAALLAVMLYTWLRWIFVFHFIVLEGKTVTAAIRSSLALTRGRRLRIFAALLLLNLTLFGAGFAALSWLSYLPSWLDINVLKAFSDHYSLTLSTLLTYMFTLLLIPVNLILLTRLFYSLGRRQGVQRYDRLEIYRSRLGRLERRAANYWRNHPRKRLLYIAIAAVYAGLILFVGFKASDTLVYAKWNVLISAHRGVADDAPENSLPAIRDAIELGVQSVELDVQLTSDGVAVLHHDYDLRRMAGVSERVPELTYEEVSRLRIGVDGNGEPVAIPTLGEALAEAFGRIKVLIDLKPYGSGEELAKEVVKQVKAHGMEDQVYIQSFDGETLRLIREIAPEIKIGRILYFALGDLTLLDVDFYTIEQIMLTEQLVERAHRSGREVWVWTVNGRRNLKEVLKFRVDAIITDTPAVAQSMVELDL